MVSEMRTPRGMRDFAPEEKLVRNELIGKLVQVFEHYGFVPIDTPLLERWEVLSAKYSGGDEILKETFSLTDQGGRELGLRYDLTVPLARFVAGNPMMKMPFKRYQLGSVYRDGPIKLGRYREFWQCDVDIVGSYSMLADAECILLANRVFASLGLDVEIHVNNRKLLNSLLIKAGVKDERAADFLLSVDKLKKIGLDGVREELISKDYNVKAIETVLHLLTKQLSAKELLTEMENILGKDNEGIVELNELFSHISSENVIFSPSLARGLSYYTGTVFEVFIKDGSFTSSLSAGGRYDNMVGNFAGSGKEIPAVGISFGLEPIIEVLRLKSMLVPKKTTTKLMLIPMKGFETDATHLAEELRASVNVEVDLMGRSVGKSSEYAKSLGIPFSIVIGENEVNKQLYDVKNMETGEKTTVKKQDLASFFSS
ncbi:MAG: histidine--tRNA ligase [Candidatus Woesearchaeota archaeon]|nr:MAG: histidine--tRNA ligase [Candidatus Woesearchaeota archaeon]